MRSIKILITEEWSSNLIRSKLITIAFALFLSYALGLTYTSISNKIGRFLKKRQSWSYHKFWVAWSTWMKASRRSFISILSLKTLSFIMGKLRLRTLAYAKSWTKAMRRLSSLLKVLELIGIRHQNVSNKTPLRSHIRLTYGAWASSFSNSFLARNHLATTKANRPF